MIKIVIIDTKNILQKNTNVLNRSHKFFFLYKDNKNIIKLLLYENVCIVYATTTFLAL